MKTQITFTAESDEDRAALHGQDVVTWDLGHDFEFSVRRGAPATDFDELVARWASASLTVIAGGDVQKASGRT